MPPRQMTPPQGPKRPGGQKQPQTPPSPKRECPACHEELESAEQLVEIVVKKRGRATGKTLKICSECNRRTVAVLMLLEPDFPDELHIYT